MGNISYFAIKTIIFYEIKSYFKEFQFNVIAPLINTCLFVFILSTIDKYYTINTLSDSYINFLVPGLVISLVIQTSFNHLSEIIISMKQIGSFNDLLISPVSRYEIFLSFLFSSIFVSIIVGILNLFILSFFVEFFTINYFNFFYYLIISIVIFSSLGAMVGFLSFTWDVQSFISNFFIMPLSFLSGTFFSIDALDQKFQFLFKYNPFYYLVTGFRSSFDQNYNISFYNNFILFLILISILTLSLHVFNKGYKVIN